ncbi:putative ribonuclease H protein [Vitis vinifera]|uniref:Putative ribonuclease H protein n=1 Tax=Vitis vinifera TaxID=29760 RepID=A0A438HYM9_VITVI|nr:putative ribonuclease H protein [Vitis vinifera]
MGEGNEGGKGNSEARRLVEGKDVGGDASKCRAPALLEVEDSLVFYVAVPSEKLKRLFSGQSQIEQGRSNVSGRLRLSEAKECLKGYELLLGIMSTTDGGLVIAPVSRNLDGDGAPEANRGYLGQISLQKGRPFSCFRKIRHFTGGTEGDEGISLLQLGKKGFFPIPLESSLVSQRSPFPKIAVVEPSRLVGPRELVSQGRLRPQTQNLPPPVGRSSVEGLTPGKMVKVQSVLESLRIRIVRENGKGNKRETWDEVCEQCLERQKLEWAALPAVFLVNFSVCPINPLWRKDFWLELQDLYGLTFPRWCVGGDFNVIRRISEKLGDQINFQHEDLKKKGARGCVIKGRGESWRVEGIDWVPISGESAVWLDRPFTEKEVRMAVFQLNKEKAPGPDGFTIAVYQQCWDVIKEDLMRVRHILDAVLIANEVVDEKKRSGEEGVVFKIDFEKAYDHVDWGLFRSCASKEGVQPKMEIVDKVADVLSRLLFRAEETGLTEGFSVGRDRTRASLLQFADDTIFFSKASLEHLQNLKIILLVFGQVSGLKINLEKNIISGLPLGGNPQTIGFWDPVVERISRRLDVGKRPISSIASKIEKMQRDFLWSGAGEGKKDHLVRWEVVSRPKELGGLGFGKISLRNIALLGKWLWRFPRERSGLWHKVIVSIYGTHPNGWDANMVVRWSHRCPWKAIAQVFQEFSPFVRLVVGNGKRIRFWEDLWWGNQSLCSQFANLYRVISVKNLTVSNVLGNSFPLSWNLNFRRNLTDSKIDLLQRLRSSSVQCVSLLLWHILERAKFLWSSKAPSKVKALAWVGLGPPRSFEDMLVIAFKGLGNSLRGKTLWQIACLTLVWIVWQEQNNRIFEDKGRSEETLWDLILFYSSLWASCSAAFRGVPLNVLQLNWIEFV